MIDLNTVFLTPGYHEPYGADMCIMEACSQYSGLDWTDEPATVNKDLARFTRALNDWTLLDSDRQKLVEFIPLLCQTGDTFSQKVKDAVDSFFEWDEASEQFGFVMPSDPIATLSELIDQVAFEIDVQDGVLTTVL